MTDPIPTLAEAAGLIASGWLSPVDLTRACLDRIERAEGGVGAFITLLADEALDAARVAEREISAGCYRGPLHGIPIGLKDLYETRGVATTAHSALLHDHVPTRSAFAVERLEAAGAILLGKLATWEFAIGGTSHDLPWPPARNPWDVERDPGYSSSGPGAAVAAGFVLGALGTDTGGSVRCPAAWCGTAGFKPSYGLVSRSGVLPFVPSLDHCGPLAWTVEDCALLMEVIAGHDPDDAASVRTDRPFRASASDGSVEGIRIGVVRDWFERDVHCGAETLAATTAAVELFRQQGADIVDVALPSMHAFVDVADVISRAESFALHESRLRATPELYGTAARRRLMAGAFVPAADYLRALQARAGLIATLRSAMEKVDLLLLPSTPDPAPLLGDPIHFADPSRWLFLRPFNVTGGPALSLCSGFSLDGLPLSLQLVGRPFEDDCVLRAGRCFEAATDHRARRPLLPEREAVPA